MSSYLLIRAAAATAGDAKIISILTAAGHTMTSISQNDVTISAPNSYDGVWISESCDSAVLAPFVTASSGGWKASPKPFWVAESGLFDEFAFASGLLAVQNKLECYITPQAGSLASGLTPDTSPQLFTTLSSIRRANASALGAGAVQILLSDKTEGSVVEWIYDVDATLADNSKAAGKRVANMFMDTATPNLNDNGAKLITSAATWMTSGSTPVIIPPTAVVGADLNVLATEHIELDWSSSTVGSGSSLSYLAEITSGDATLTDPTSVKPVLNMPNTAGVVKVRLTVNNGQQTAQATKTVTAIAVPTVAKPASDAAVGQWIRSPSGAPSHAAVLSDGSEASFLSSTPDPVGSSFSVVTDGPLPSNSSRVVLEFQTRCRDGVGSFLVNIMQDTKVIATNKAITNVPNGTSWRWKQIVLTADEAVRIVESDGPLTITPAGTGA